MKWDTEDFQKAITDWLIDELDKRAIRHAVFSREAGLDKTRDGRIFRKAKEGVRNWKIADLCKLADYFGLSPAYIIKEIEKRYRLTSKGRPD
jgi:hypothetical protein